MLLCAPRKNALRASTRRLLFDDVTGLLIMHSKAASVTVYDLPLNGLRLDARPPAQGTINRRQTG